MCTHCTVLQILFSLNFLNQFQAGVVTGALRMCCSGARSWRDRRQKTSYPHFTTTEFIEINNIATFLIENKHQMRHNSSSGVANENDINNMNWMWSREAALEIGAARVRLVVDERDKLRLRDARGRRRWRQSHRAHERLLVRQERHGRWLRWMLRMLAMLGTRAGSRTRARAHVGGRCGRGVLRLRLRLRRSRRNVAVNYGCRDAPRCPLAIAIGGSGGCIDVLCAHVALDAIGNIRETHASWRLPHSLLLRMQRRHHWVIDRRARCRQCPRCRRHRAYEFVDVRVCGTVLACGKGCGCHWSSSSRS